MKLPKELTTVTPLSKAVALLMFILLPIIAFFYGMKFQQKMTKYVPSSQTEPVACTMDAKICPDGTYVSRTGPNCEFSPCPAVTNQNPNGKFCGGIAAVQCPTGYECQYEGNYPDAGGTCVSIKMLR